MIALIGARVAFLTPQPIEEGRPDPDKDVRNLSLRKFSDGLKEVASSQNALFVDQFDPYLALMMQARSGNPAAKIGGGDAVHPGAAGQTLMAWAILKSLNAPALVSRAEIDAAAGKIGATAQCRIENLSKSGNQVSFTRTDDALPLPIDPKGEAALKLAPVLTDLDLYELKVTGLAPGQYDVKIDGESVAKADAAELGHGVNLATRSGPITQQAQQVLSLVFKKNNVYFRRWRQVQLFDFPSWAQGPEVNAKRDTELARLDAEIADLEKQINAARVPTSHRFELTPAN